MSKHSFCTAINCMDGRVQVQVIEFLQKHFGVEYVDCITEAGPVRFLAGGSDGETLRSIRSRIDVSLVKHKSAGIAAAAHFDCTGNPIPDAEQQRQLRQAVENLKRWYPDVPVMGLWLDEKFSVQVIEG